MTEPTRLIINQAAIKLGYKIYPDTEFIKIVPDVYKFTQYYPNRPSEDLVAVVKGYEVAIYQY